MVRTACLFLCQTGLGPLLSSNFKTAGQGQVWESGASASLLEECKSKSTQPSSQE